MEDVHNFINIGATNPIQILNQHEIFWRFCMCPSNDTFDKNKKQVLSKQVLGLNSKDRKSTRDKANISNPKVNRGCALLTANRTSADCVQISLGPSIPYIPLGVYHTGRFNAMQKIWSWECRTGNWFLHWYMLINLINLNVWRCPSIPGMFSIFHISFYNFLLRDMILRSHVVTWCLSLWHDNCELKNMHVFSYEHWATLCHIAKYKWISVFW